ncbi:TOMM precursor leader peptide-binding protein [Raineyella sp. W15-4]|uniref:TOMM precursor leader peptide-binding protein n=1 Tax=Raineyella sp. W15-4 TaxID=3081651 RepID=UPI002954B673|nr:TOMM precursor leader peptide-binding protein [Raineyella sp. W15-4]WOQ15554.1 TOMM precursor leader peptide-binding protein [Raineyella sp. W15-4]
MLADLTGEHALGDLADRWNLPLRAVDNLVTTLRTAGLLAVDGSQQGPLGGLPVARVVAAPALAADLTSGLLEAGVGTVHVIAPGAAPGTARGRLRDRVRVADTVDRRPLPPGTPTVVAPGCLEPDPALVETLMRADDPHIVVRPRPAGVLVGPFVLPGRTSCLVCGDLGRAARDASWVEQRAAMTAIEAPYAAALRDWTIATVLTQLACWAAGGRPDLADRTVELDTRDWRQSWRAWRPHPACGCGWSPPGAASAPAWGQTVPPGAAASAPSSSTRPGSATILSTASP